MLDLLIAACSPEIFNFFQQSFKHDDYRLHCVSTLTDCIQAAEQLFDTLSAAFISDDFNDDRVYESVSHLHQIGLPIIMIAPSERTAAAFHAGADDVLTWPQSPLLIERRLQGLLETRELRANTVRDKWYRSMVDSNVAGIFRSSLNGQLLFANKHLATLLGYDNELDLIKRNLANDVYLNPQDRADLMREALTNDDYVQWEGMLKRKDGTPIPVTITIRTVQSETGRVIFLEGFVTDNSKRYHAEQTAQSERQFNDTLREVIGTLNTSLETKDVLEKIEMGVSILLPGVSVAITQIVGDEVPVVQQRGMNISPPPQDISTSNHTNLSLKQVIKDAQPIIISHTDTDVVASYIGLPIISHERVIGMMNLMSNIPGALTPEIAARMQAFADQAAIALDNAYSVQQLRTEIAERQRAETAEREQRLLAEALREAAATINSNLNLDAVLDRIMEMLTHIMPLDVVNIMLIEDGIARSVRSRGYEQYDIAEEIRHINLLVQDIPNMSEMLTTHQPLVVSDTHQYPNWISIPATAWIRSNAMAPIIANDHVIGFLDVDSMTPNTFNDSHGEQLQAFADQAAIAIQNARMYEASQQHNRELESRVAERTAELEQKRAELLAILDSIQEGVVGSIFVPGTHEVAERHVNTTLVKMFGYSVDEWDVRKLRPDDISPEEFDQLLQHGRDMANQEGGYHTVQKVRHKDGTTFDISITGNSIRTGDGQPIGRVTVYRDISQERELQARQARFVAAAAHELRNPLSALKMRLEIAQRKPQDIERHLRILTEVSNRMERLVTDLLNQNRFERGVIELKCAPVELHPFLQQIQTLLTPEAERKQIALLTDLPPEPLTVMADEDRLHQVITNLTVNAITYSPERSTVTLRLRRADEGHLLIQVEDTGSGIEPEHLPHLFEPFYRVRKVGNGMGLGLSITREIVQLHGGTLSAESEVGRGTRFNVLLKG